MNQSWVDSVTSPVMALEIPLETPAEGLPIFVEPLLLFLFFALTLGAVKLDMSKDILALVISSLILILVLILGGW